MTSFQDLPMPVKTYHAQTYDRIHPKHSSFDGKDKTIVITGGATGIGFEITKSFAEAGVARIIVISRSPAPQEKAQKELEPRFPSTKFVFYQASVTDKRRMTEILNEVERIDVIVLCAAAGVSQSAAEMSEENLREPYETNVIATFLTIQTYLRLPTPAAGKKTLLYVSSNASHIMVPGIAAYGSSKAAATRTVSYFAGEQQDASKVKLLSFHPGAFYTDLVQTAGVPKDALEWEDITLPGHFAVWLASNESDFLHGKFVWAHWDVDELIALKDRVEKDKDFLTIGLVQ